MDGYLSSLEDIDREHQQIFLHYNRRAQGLIGEDLINLRLEQTEAWIQALEKHRRVLKFLKGEPIEPVAHPAEGVLIGTFGGVTG